ncbi:MAG: PP0621 family protein [Sulfurovaceae bacterium]|nr:PP0621 family protein [Sulfurovaceae bacterium]
MLLKFIIIGLLFFGIYKLFGGKLLPTTPSQKDVQNMLECDTCGTFVSEKDMIRFSGRFYCSKACKDKHQG